MKILVFSDTHLYLPFDSKKFNFLKKIVFDADQVIINGDFFDSYMNTFDEFVKSPWNKLFPILKSKKTVYIYGNHDQKKFSDNRTNLFSEMQTERYKMKTDNKIYIFEHGHKTRPTPDMLFKMSWKLKHYGIIFVHLARNLMIKIFGKFIIQLMFGRLNKGSKKIIKKLYKPKNNEFYIVGHNHYGEIDEKNQFATSGMILYGFAQYIIINLKTGKISLHEKWYK